MKTANISPSGDGFPSMFKKSVTRALLFIIGLAVGLAIFFPRDLHWHYMIARAERDYEGMSIKYNLSEVGWYKAGIDNMEILYRGHRYFLPLVRVRLGLSPLLQAVVDTGPEMFLSLERGKKISALGEVSLDMILPDQEAAGLIWIDAEVYFQTWDEPPSGGEIELRSRGTLSLENFMVVRDLDLKAVLTGNQLEIQNLRALEPVEFISSGYALLDWDNQYRSTYQVQGRFILAGESHPFEQQGRIIELLPKETVDIL
jgi:hypothetical protein